MRLPTCARQLPRHLRRSGGSNEAAIPLLTGHWELKLVDESRYTVTSTRDGEVVVEGRYTLMQDQIVLTDEQGSLACLRPETESGTYKWAFEKEALTLTPVEDECGGRNVILTSHSWLKQDKQGRFDNAA